MPSISAYPMCCGASIVTGFNGKPNDLTQPARKYNHFTGKFEESPANTGETVGDKLLKDLAGGYTNRLYTCILTTTQYKHWGEWLKANGFMFTNRFVNSVHDSILYHFVYVKKSKSCRVKPLLVPPKWDEFPGPTPNAKSSKDKAAVPPSVEAVAA